MLSVWNACRVLWRCWMGFPIWDLWQPQIHPCSLSRLWNHLSFSSSHPYSLTTTSNSPWSLTGFHTIFTTTFLGKQGRKWTLPINTSGTRPSTPIITSLLIMFWQLNSAGNVISNDSLKMPQVKKNLMPYILPLKAEGIMRSEFEELLWKEKDVKGFSSLIDLLHIIKVPSCCLPVLGCAYNSSLNSPYDSFLGLNTWSSCLYLFYFSHNNLDIVVHEGLIVNQMICNLHYFASLCFNQFEAHAFMLMLNEPQDITQCPISGEISKKIHTEYWKQKDPGKYKKKAKNLWPGGISGTTRTSGKSGTSGQTSFSLIDYLYHSFIVDNTFSDLL